jgi:hypothetical protein
MDIYAETVRLQPSPSLTGEALMIVIVVVRRMSKSG